MQTAYLLPIFRNHLEFFEIVYIYCSIYNIIMLHNKSVYYVLHDGNSVSMKHYQFLGHTDNVG